MTLLESSTVTDTVSCEFLNGVDYVQNLPDAKLLSEMHQPNRGAAVLYFGPWIFVEDFLMSPSSDEL